MPQETLRFPPVYVVIGAWRLVHDPSLHRPILASCSTGLKYASIASSALVIVSWPLTRLWVRFFMKQSRLIGFNDEAKWLGLPLVTVATLSLVSSQIGYIINFFLRKQLQQARQHVYESTVKSRGKSSDWWGGYVEEWQVPPVERARKRDQERQWWGKLASPLGRFIILRVVLLPLHFIPFLPLFASAAISSMSIAELLHAPMFASKRMSKWEKDVWMTEREVQYRSFGFVAALFERIPIVGVVFSISNRIGAAMWAHDLEKRQYLFRTGTIEATRRYESKTSAILSDVGDDAIGAFPRKRVAPSAAAQGGWGRVDGVAAMVGVVAQEVPGTGSLGVAGT